RHGQRQVWVGAVRRPGRVAGRALHDAPPESEPAHTFPRNVDLLAVDTADVADQEVAGTAIEADPPRVAQPCVEDLRKCRGTADERVVRRDVVDRVAAGRAGADS